MITSPSPAVRLLYREALPPRTLKHMTSLAPVLSATSSRVCIWIMGHLASFVGCGECTGDDCGSSRRCAGAPYKSSKHQSGLNLRRFALARECLLGTLPD